jgi:hypothetical protein
MARRKGRRSRPGLGAIGGTLARAAEALERLEEPVEERRRRTEGSTEVLPGVRRAKRRANRALRPKSERRVERPPPRQARLFQQRAALERALEAAGSAKLGGRRARERIARGIPQAVYDAICADRKKRRQSLFARGLTGKGAKAPKRERDWRSEVKC